MEALQLKALRNKELHNMKSWNTRRWTSELLNAKMHKVSSVKFRSLLSYKESIRLLQLSRCTGFYSRFRQQNTPPWPFRMIFVPRKYVTWWDSGGCIGLSAAMAGRRWPPVKCSANIFSTLSISPATWNVERKRSLDKLNAFRKTDL